MYIKVKYNGINVKTLTHHHLPKFEIPETHIERRMPKRIGIVMT